MSLLNRIEASFFGDNYGRPKGLRGRLLGERMIQQHAPETAWTLELLDLQPGDQVLELGFGAGRAVELVTKQVTSGHVYGLDISEEMVRSASRRNAQAIKAGRVSLQQGDLLTTLPFTENQFDKIYTIQTFYFWKDPLAVMAELLRVLKPGGKLVVTLSTGTSDESQKSWFEQIQEIVEMKVVPGMQQLGFRQAYLEQGPASRQFNTTAIIGVK
jgi:ubiquinone/menaquinone biosynthesis C-methylase UbiE